VRTAVYNVAENSKKIIGTREHLTL